MDAEEFVKQLRRMDCQYHREFSLFDACNTPEQVVEEVEKWAKEHPIKTRLSVFLEILPNAPIHPDTGIVKISPCEVDAVLRGNCPGVGCCPECRKKFWLAEVE